MYNKKKMMIKNIENIKIFIILIKKTNKKNKVWNKEYKKYQIEFVM